MSSQGLDRHARLAILSEAAADDREHGMPLPHHRLAAPGAGESPVGIRKVRIPGRGSTSLMRVMQTNACSLSCGYCPTFCGGHVKRTALAPEEVARTFVEAHRAGLVSGLFLTSGVPGRAVRAMDRMLDAVHILRRREGFTGYVHMKVLPGAQRDQVREAARLCDRVSVNLEGPRDDVVRRLAKEKDLSGDLLPSLELAGRLARDARLEHRLDGPARMGTTTQFVVGAQGEQDQEILGLVGRLERQGLLHHAHFSAFQPVAGTPMEGLPPTPSAREFRLYQAEHLMRQYGFRFDELPFAADGNLPLEHDPKTAWALAHPEDFPLDVARAAQDLLLRVPGVGPRAAERIVTERRRVVLRGAEDLRRLGVDVYRAGYYLTLGGRRLARERPPLQQGLFADGRHLPSVVWSTPTPPCAYR
ncbi:MAG TPA: radical SAM protein [Methylomirabilota bacterium]|nr:radical SAM protein [Methylomirabilota bacterium]